MVGLTVHFEKPAGWADTVHIHFWGVEPGGGSTDWPGAPMMAEGANGFVWRWSGATAAHFVIHDGHGRQTADQFRRREGWLDVHGRWHDRPPEALAEPPQHPAPRLPADRPAAAPAANPPERRLPDFREETIYFLITTRFYDGDPSNNFFCRDRIEFDAGGKPVDPHWRGDFKGLIERLDYIRDLGFTAIWITPPVENRSGLDYHGYHLKCERGLPPT